jgi:ketosteroid isomerase-like protein
MADLSLGQCWERSLGGSRRRSFARDSRAAKEATVSEAKKVLEQAVERWNATDRDGWAALYTDDVIYEAPGGSRIAGLADLKEKYFDALVTAAPDRRVAT